MYKLMECDDNVVKNISTILKYLNNIFDEDILIYAVSYNNNLIGYIAQCSTHGAYLKFTKDNNIDITLFMKDENNKLHNMEREGYSTILDEEEILFIDENKIQTNISLEQKLHQDVDGYDGHISYRQYNPNNDTYCEIQYQQMYNNDNKIYEYHTKNIDSIYIDKKYSKRKSKEQGLMLLGEYFIVYDIRENNTAEFIANIKKVFKKVDKEDYKRYYRIRYIDKNYMLHTGYPYTKGYTTNEIKEYLASLGFKTAIDKFILDTYNGQNNYINELNILLEEINKLTEKDTNMIMSLKRREQ